MVTVEAKRKLNGAQKVRKIEPTITPKNAQSDTGQLIRSANSVFRLDLAMVVRIRFGNESYCHNHSAR
jgi:hypothetical protein